MSKVKDEARKNQEWFSASLQFIDRVKTLNYELKNPELKKLFDEWDKEWRAIVSKRKSR
jgi:hypothetical protein